jgi:glutaminyl-peptide cyclotransferase
MRVLALMGITMMLPLVAASGTSAPLAQGRAGNVPVFTYHIVNIYPHDRTAFTQGLQYVDGVLYEGTGLEGQSTIRKVKLETGQVLQQRRLDSRYFGEGIVVWKKSLIQLTYTTEIGFVYDLATFDRL